MTEVRFLPCRVAANRGGLQVRSTGRNRGTARGLAAEQQAQYAESAMLEQAIRANLKGLGYGN